MASLSRPRTLRPSQRHGLAAGGSHGGADTGMNLRDLPPTLTVEQTGQLLGISRYAAYRAAATGELPILRLGRRLLVPTPRLLRMLGVDSTPDESMVEAS